MPAPNTLAKRDYNKILADLRRIIAEGKEEAEHAATQALTESYWAIGQRIHKEKLNTRAGCHDAILGIERTFSEGRYLNQELVGKRLERVV